MSRMIWKELWKVDYLVDLSLDAYIDTFLAIGMRGPIFGVFQNVSVLMFCSFLSSLNWPVGGFDDFRA